MCRRAYPYLVVAELMHSVMNTHPDDAERQHQERAAASGHRTQSIALALVRILHGIGAQSMRDRALLHWHADLWRSGPLRPARMHGCVLPCSRQVLSFRLLFGTGACCAVGHGNQHECMRVSWLLPF